MPLNFEDKKLQIKKEIHIDVDLEEMKENEL